jgi:hypothetical protein
MICPGRMRIHVNTDLNGAPILLSMHKCLVMLDARRVKLGRPDPKHIPERGNAWYALQKLDLAHVSLAMG